MRLLIDITELEGWKGKLTGVPRVMFELCLRFAEEKDTYFIKWDDVRNNFIVVDPTYLINKTMEDPISSVQPLQQNESIIIRVAKKIVRHSRHARQSVLFIRRLLSTDKRVLPNRDSINPQDGDVLFILAEWHSKDTAFTRKLMALKSSKVKLVQFAHDILPLVTPQYSGHATAYMTEYVERCYPVFDMIIANSQNTKKDLSHWMADKKLKVPPIEVVRLGDNFINKKAVRPDDAEIQALIRKNENFILCVGTVEARKNHALLYYAYKLAKEKNIKLPYMVVVGRRGWKTDDILEIIINDPDTKDAFIFLHDSSDDELSWLYQNCMFSVYPSFYEGWGLPIAESIAYGVPCVASNTSSMPEVAGDLITYFSPSSSDECLKSINDLLLPGKLDQARSRIGKYQTVSWDETFKQVRNSLRQL